MFFRDVNASRMWLVIGSLRSEFMSGENGEGAGTGCRVWKGLLLLVCDNFVWSSVDDKVVCCAAVVGGGSEGNINRNVAELRGLGYG